MLLPSDPGGPCLRIPASQPPHTPHPPNPRRPPGSAFPICLLCLAQGPSLICSSSFLVSFFLSFFFYAYFSKLISCSVRSLLPWPVYQNSAAEAVGGRAGFFFDHNFTLFFKVSSGLGRPVKHFLPRCGVLSSVSTTHVAAGEVGTNRTLCQERKQSFRLV